jgi:protein-S-isoprenylcysteine O-methyltransferase Ste14
LRMTAPKEFDEMPEKSISAYLLFAVTMVAVAAASLFTRPWGLLLCLTNLSALVLETLMLRFSRREILRRRIPLSAWWDMFMTPLIALCAIAAAVLSAYDTAYAQVSVLPYWCFLLGLIVLMTAYFIFAQSMRAYAPHAVEKYGEAGPQGGERGPYEVVRHPVMLSVILGGISIPLFMGSGIGFIPVGVMLAALIARVAAEDDWRFNNYDWYYDYTKEVSYRLIPFIW